MATHIYTLSDPATGEVRYVGKARDVAQRFGGHMRAAARGDRRYPVYAWIKKLTAKGQRPEVATVLTLPDDADWQSAEREMIAAYGLANRLLNVAEGGESPYCSPEVRSANGARHGWHSGDKRLVALKRALTIGVKETTSAEHRDRWLAAMRYCFSKRPQAFQCWAGL